MILLIALLMLWAVGLAYLLAWYVAFGEFDGYRTNVPGAALAYGGGGLIAVGLLYVGIGSLLRADRR